MMIEAASRIFAITSKCSTVTTDCIRNPQRTAAHSTITMVKPEYMAPTTK